ncbi:MAG: E3 binding domain-containing protein, partial [Gemmatimonadota bacterium]|nr:E3 binding domain-containing protein [Gemmatimonadota bacterium]
MTAIKVPPLGESIVEATVSRWLKKEGEPVAAGDTLVELETDKITVEVPALSNGMLTKRAVNEGDVVKVDQVLGEIQEGAAASAAAPSAPAPQAPAPAAAPASAPRGSSKTGGQVKASPAAQRVAAEQKVDLSTVQGTGRGGVVSKPDVIEQSARGGAPAAVAAPAASAPAPA